MLLRAKIRSGEEDLSVFESLLLEDSSLQRAHSSPTLQDSSLASQASSSRGTSSKASACSSSKPRQEGQRNSYRQAVKKWSAAGAPGAAWCRSPNGRLSPSEGFYLRSRRVRSSAWRGSRGEGLTPRLPATMTPHLAPQSSRVAEEVQIQRGCWCRRWGEQLWGQGGGGVFEDRRWMQQQQTAQFLKKDASRSNGTPKGPTFSILSFLPSLFFFQGTSPATSSQLFPWPFNSVRDQTCLHSLNCHLIIDDSRFGF